MDPLVKEILDFGVSQKTLISVLALPILASFVAFSRQIIGMRSLGIYLTLLLTYVFDALSLKYGILIFIFILISGLFFRYLFKKIRILFLPRIAMILSGISLSLFFLFFFGKYLQIEGLQIISIFPILVVVLLMEKIISTMLEYGEKMAFLMTFETFVLSLICFFLLNWNFLQKVLLEWPIPVFLLTFLFNIFLGKWTGLRLFEYFRFKELIDYLSEKEKK